jgi:hypothetical protein
VSELERFNFMFGSPQELRQCRASPVDSASPFPTSSFDVGARTLSSRAWRLNWSSKAQLLHA